MKLFSKLSVIALVFSACAQANTINILDFPQPDNNPEEFYALTEIPAGGSMKPTPKPALSLPTASSLCR